MIVPAVSITYTGQHIANLERKRRDERDETLSRRLLP